MELQGKGDYMKTFKLTTDNAQPRVTVHATVSEVENACKQLLGWRTPTKRYDSIFERFRATGSSNYDKVIVHLHERGM